MEMDIKQTPIGVYSYDNGMQANLMDYSMEHPEVRFILYSGSDIEDAIVWMVSESVDDDAINALIHKAKTRRGFYQMINRESLSNEKMGGFVLYGA